MNILLMSSHMNDFAYNCPHIGLYRLQHLVKSDGHGCDVWDSSLVDIDKKLEKMDPNFYDAIGISVSHNEMEQDVSAINTIRRKYRGIGKTPLIIAGGQEATFNGEQWLKECGVDLIATGYAESNFLEIINTFSSLGRRRGFERITGLDGVMWLDDEGKMSFNPNRVMTPEDFRFYNHNIILDLNIPYEEYWEKARKETKGLEFSKSVFIPEAVRLYTSNSCPWNCGFCSSSGFLSFSQGEKSRTFRLNAEEIYKQIVHHTNKYGARCFMFNDDEFLLDKQRDYELCEKIIKGKEKGEISRESIFNCQGRMTDFLLSQDPITIDKRFIETLTKAGFHSVGMGFETFSDKLLQAPSMNKKGYSRKKSLAVIDAMLKRNFIPHVFNILFIPEASIDDIKGNIREYIGLFRRGAQIVVNPHLRALPGAPIYGDPRYPIKSRTFKSELTGREIKISDYYIPLDSFVAECAEGLLPLVDKEIKKFEKRWGYEKIPKSFSGIFHYIAAAKLFNDNPLVQIGYDVIDEKISDLESRIVYE